jgi:hypothetical protein
LARVRSPAGRFAVLPGISVRDLKGDKMAEVIAKEDVVVHDPNLGIDRKLIAGQPVPPDLVDVYRKETGDGSGSRSYDDQTVEDLQAEVDRRGLEVEGTGKDGKVVKADLVKALEADDAS